MAIEALRAFAEANGAKTSFRVGIGGDNNHAGRSLFTLHRTLPGEPLLFVPECLLVVSDLASQADDLRDLLGSPEADRMCLQQRPELMLMLFLVADRARHDGGGVWDGTCTVDDDNNELKASAAGVRKEHSADDTTSADPSPSSSKAVHEAFVGMLRHAPRLEDGTLSEPARALHWLHDQLQAAASVELSREGAGMLLAICDLRGEPSYADFCRCAGLLDDAWRAGAPSSPASSHDHHSAPPLAERPSRASFYATLPADYSELPMQWPDAQLDALLPPARAGFARAQRAERDALIKLLDTHAPSLWRAAKDAWFEHARWADPLTWAYATVRSRALGLRIGGRTVAALVPLADLANHGPCRAVNAAWGFDDDRGGFLVRCTRGVPADGEVVYSYGEKPNGDLLFHYGFVLRDADNTDEDGEPLDDALLRLDGCETAISRHHPHRRGSVCVYVRPCAADAGVGHAIALLREAVDAERDDVGGGHQGNCGEGDGDGDGGGDGGRDGAMPSAWLVPIGTAAPGAGVPPQSDDNELAALTALGRRASAALEELQPFLESYIEDSACGPLQRDSASRTDERGALEAGGAVESPSKSPSAWPEAAVSAAATVCRGEARALRWLADACMSSVEAQLAMR